MPVEYARNEQGRYQTDGLSAKDFHRVFELIQKQQRKNRHKARRTLTPRTMGKRNRELDAFLNLGKKKGGTYFTPEDIRNFDAARKTHKSKFHNTVPGITYAQLVAQSTNIDIKRANNRVSDGTGIKAATFLGIKHNLAVVSVKASEESVHQHHRVRIRFEEWDQAVEDKGVGNFLAQISVSDVIHAFAVGLENGCHFGRVDLIGYANVIADRCAIAHLEVKGIFIRLHLLEGREDVELGIPACPITTNPHDFAYALVVTQFVHLDTNITRFYPITPCQA